MDLESNQHTHPCKRQGATFRDSGQFILSHHDPCACVSVWSQFAKMYSFTVYVSQLLTDSLTQIKETRGQFLTGLPRYLLWWCFLRRIKNVRAINDVIIKGVINSQSFIKY